MVVHTSNLKAIETFKKANETIIKKEKIGDKYLYLFDIKDFNLIESLDDDIKREVFFVGNKNKVTLEIK